MRDSGRSVRGAADIKWGMASAPRFLFPLCILAYLPLACSTDDGTPKTIPGPPPTGGSATTGGSGGSTATTGGTGGSAQGGMTGGTGGGSTGTVKPGGACTKTPECEGTGFKCNTTTHVCDCSADKPETCGVDAAAVCTVKMTDPDNCGMCGTKCDAGAVCVAGVCGTKPTDVVAATGCGGGVRLATDGKNIYWTEMMTGKVRSVPVAGGAIAEVATGQLSPTQIAVDATGVYWVNQGDATAASSKVQKKALTAAAAVVPTSLVTATGMDKIPALAVNKGKVYYAFEPDAADVAGVTARAARVHEATLNAGGDMVMANGDVIVGIAVNYDAGKMDIGGTPKGIAVTDASVVWGTPSDRGAVESHSLPATVTTAADNKAGYGKLGKSVGALLPSGVLGIDAMYGYWADGEKFVRDLLTAQEGMAENITTAPDAKVITAFAINATKVYASTDDGKVFTHSLLPPTDPNDEKTFVAPVLMARDQKNASSMVIDATKIYWITEDCMIRSSGL
jgi:hypothetical protein